MILGRNLGQWAIATAGGQRPRQRVEPRHTSTRQMEASGSRAATQHLRQTHDAQLGLVEWIWSLLTEHMYAYQSTFIPTFTRVFEIKKSESNMVNYVCIKLRGLVC